MRADDETYESAEAFLKHLKEFAYMIWEKRGLTKVERPLEPREIVEMIIAMPEPALMRYIYREASSTSLLAIHWGIFFLEQELKAKFPLANKALAFCNSEDSDNMPTCAVVAALGALDREYAKQEASIKNPGSKPFGETK